MTSSCAIVTQYAAQIPNKAMEETFLLVGAHIDNTTPTSSTLSSILQSIICLSAGEEEEKSRGWERVRSAGPNALFFRRRVGGDPGLRDSVWYLPCSLATTEPHWSFPADKLTKTMRIATLNCQLAGTLLCWCYSGEEESLLEMKKEK